MIFTWWEFNGKRKRLPREIVFTKYGGIDRRYKFNKEFLKNKKWKYRDPVWEMYAPKIVNSVFEPNIMLEQLMKK